MAEKFLWTGIMASLLLCFLVPGSAMATRIELTLGWHNLGNEFFLVAKGAEQDFSVGDRIKGNKLKRSTLNAPGGIDLTDLNLGSEYNDVWGVDTFKKFDKWIDKKTKKALKKAAKSYQKDTTGKRRGWKVVYMDWQGGDIWELYQNDPFVAASFNKIFDGKKIKGKIGNQKFVSVLDIFANPIGETLDPSTPVPEPGTILLSGETPSTPVPEPGTMLLSGIGLLGIYIVGKKLKK